MPSERKKVTNLIHGDVVIEDLGIRLRGKGDFSIVPMEAASVSRDLVRNSRLVKVETIGVQDPVPFWPFMKKKVKPQSRPHSPPAQMSPVQQSSELSELKRYLSGINQALQSLLERPIPAPPEVVAAHVRTAQSMGPLPAGLPGAPNLPGAGSGRDPMFIPSKIVPDNTSTFIKVKDGSVAKDDFEDGLDALRKARGK